MRLKKNVYDERILRIVGQYMRIRTLRRVEHEQICIQKLVLLNGFTYNFSKTEQLGEALKDVYAFIENKREESRLACGKPYTPAPQEILMFMKSRL